MHIFYIYVLYIRFIYITVFRLFMPKSKCSSHGNTVNLLRKKGVNTVTVYQIHTLEPKKLRT